MIKNIIFIILFILLYGGLYLLISRDSTTLTDRNGYGEFTNSTYDCERFSMKMEYDESWVIFDGKSVEESLYSTLSHKEIETMYGSAIDKIRFIGGASTPDFTMVCLAATDTARPDSEYNADAMKKTLEYMKTAINGQGGKVGDIICYTATAKGSGKPMMIYGYDYEVGGEKYSHFFSFTSSGKDTVLLSGTYNSEKGLDSLTDFVENKMYFYSETPAEV